MSETVRVYVNAQPVDAPSAGRPIDAVRAWDDALADRVVAGERMITDSRGLPVGDDYALHNGAIFRVVAARARAGEAVDQDGDA